MCTWGKNILYKFAIDHICFSSLDFFLVISCVIQAYKQLSMVPPLAVQRRPSNDGARSFHVRYTVYLHVLSFGFVWINGFQQFNAT